MEQSGKSLGELPIMSIENPTLAHFRHFSSLFTHFPSTPVENVRQINPFYAKQSQFQKWQKNINAFITMRYRNLDTLMGGKTKPIQTQSKPIFYSLAPLFRVPYTLEFSQHKV
jgi:hypothetical protein